MATSLPELRELPKNTVRLLGSTQVITTVFSVVKELVENSLDAGSKLIDIKLENYGLDKIEIRDNGHGIPASHMSCVAKRYHTSKISDFSDLEHLETYGFRGEALGSLCSVSQLSITTKTKDDDLSLTFTFNTAGEVTGSRPSHLTQGTTITAVNLFKNFPVRRQLYNSVKKKKEELKKVETLMYAYGIIYPDVRVTLRHDKDVAWQKPSQSDKKTVLQGVLGRNVFCQLEHKIATCKEVSLEAYLPKFDSDPQVTGRATNDRGFLFVNNRPVHLKEIEKEIKKHFMTSHKCESGKYPVYFLSLVLPSTEVDVNLDPNKTKVYLLHQDVVMTELRKMLEEVYGSVDIPSKHVQKDVLTEKNGQMIESDNCSERLNDVIVKTPNHFVESNFTKISSVHDLTVVNGNLPVLEVTDTQEDVLSSSTNHVVVVDHGNENACSSEMSRLQKICNKKVTPGGSASDDTLNHEETTLNVPDVLDLQQGCFDIIKDCLLDEKEVSEIVEVREMEHVKEPGVLFKQKTQDKTDDEDISLLDDSLKDDIIELMAEKTDCDRHGDTSVKKQTENVCNKDVRDSSGQKKIPVGQSLSDDLEFSSDDELWSRGQALKSNTIDIQPVTLLNAGKRNLSDSVTDTPPPKKKCIDLDETQPTLFDVFSNTPRQLSSNLGYQAYIKTNRPKVLEANPSSDFERISELLRDGWQKLSVDEKEEYEELSIRTSKHSSKSAQRDNTPTVKASKQLSKKMNLKKNELSVRDQILEAAKKNSSSNTPTHVIDFSMKELKKVFSCNLYNSQMELKSDMEPIGQIKSCGVWTCCRGNKIYLLNSHRVQETTLYHKLMADHTLLTSPLEQPIKLSPQNVGGQDAWRMLTDLDREMSCNMYYSITDQRLLSNGFKIRCYTDNEAFHAEIIAMATYIPVLGTADVAEILELIINTNASSLYKCRPLKILNYLQGEAVRMARQLPRQQNKEDILDLFDQIHTDIPKNCEVCLHDKPFYHLIYNIDDVPQTQTQTS